MSTLLPCFSMTIIIIFTWFLIALFIGTGVGTSFFQDIQPKAIKLLILEAREKLEQWLLETSTLATFSTNEGRKKVSAVGLPGSIEIYKSGGKFPKQLLLEIEKLQLLGGVKDLLQRHGELEKNAIRSFLAIDEVDESILKEEKIDILFRSRYSELMSGSGPGSALKNGSALQSKSASASGSNSGSGSVFRLGSGSQSESVMRSGSKSISRSGSGSGSFWRGSISGSNIVDKGTPSNVLNADIKVRDSNMCYLHICFLFFDLFI